jgi:hypothetical protein
MADSHRNGTLASLTEDQARRLISHNLAELLNKGSCTIRVRRLPDEDRVTFLAESHNRWEPAAGMDYRGQPAKQLIETLRAIGVKRGKDVHIAAQSSGNHDDITIGFHKDAVSHHRGNLAQYVMGQLFWD